MSSIVRSLGDVLRSILELLGSIVQTALDLVRAAFQAVFNVVGAVLASVLEAVRGAVHAAGGVGKFVVGNLGAIIVLGLLVFGYLQYQRSQGRAVKVGDKKLN